MSWSENFWPIMASLVSGGSLLTFVLGLLQRRDAQVERRRADDLRRAERERVYEVAFRRADAWGRQLAQLAGPLALARSDDEEYREALLDLMASYLGQHENGIWRLKDHPDFLAEARHELELVEGGVSGPCP